jgi:hypothetical protein
MDEEALPGNATTGVVRGSRASARIQSLPQCGGRFSR